ncbi:MAG: 2-succinyl-5-enolpyruvyl-6-hydroxy-3-cyclohexene-1-carboxylate synthase [Bradymonadia bacterium]
MNDGGVQATWALHFVSSLQAAGITRAVVSPGSRSTPLVWALGQSSISVITVIDERVAGFVALGASRADERPTLLVCTSGTAGAHYYPAVIEAHQTGVPLVVCTADRPPELQGNGSSQTIDQTRLFGEFSTAFELGRPDGSEVALAGARRLAHQAVAAAESGPVHINVPLAKPLEPPADWVAPSLPREAPRVGHRRPRGIDPAEAASWLEPLARCRRIAIVAGPQRVGARAHTEAARELAERLGATLLAECASQWGAGSDAHGISGIDDFITDANNAPDGVLQLGFAPVSVKWTRWLATSGVPHVVVCERGYLDTQNTACLVHSGDALDATMPALCLAAQHDVQANVVKKRQTYRCSSTEWKAAHATARSSDSVPGVAATASVISALPTEAQLLIGNSLAIRDLDAASAASPPRGPVLSQRGAAGIDGLISGALGARWATGRPTCVLLGDVSAAHDLSGLAALVQSGESVVVVVIDNGGGRIFERLPVANNPHTREQLTEHWLTPVQWPFAAVAEALGVTVFACDAATGDVASAAREAFSRGGAVMLHVTVDGDDDRAARDGRAT